MSGTIAADLQKKLDIEYHREAAAKYDAGVTSYFHFYHVHSLEPWIRRLLRRKPQALVVDLGTGTGVVACTLARLGCRVRAIDHSPEMLAIAAERAKSEGVQDRVQFDLGDGEELPYTPGSFDAVTVQGVLHHLSDYGPLLREAMRVLRPGGELYISEPCIESTVVSQFLNRALRSLKRLFSFSGACRHSVSDHEAPISGPALVSTLESMGFKTETEYLVNVGAVRFFPEPTRIWITLLLSAFTRRRRGDLVFVIATKSPVSSG